MLRKDIKWLRGRILENEDKNKCFKPYRELNIYDRTKVETVNKRHPIIDHDRTSHNLLKKHNKAVLVYYKGETK